MYHPVGTPVKDENSNEEENDVSISNEDDLDAEMVKFENQLAAIMMQESANSIDITKIDAKRYLIPNSRDRRTVGESDKFGIMKLASLEGTVNKGDQEDSPLKHDKTLAGSQDAQSKALLNYFAELGCSDKSNDTIDLEYLEELLRNADINTQDVHGQSVMYEVAREWSTDMANYLWLKGIDIDSADHFGRTPLFVAVASNYPEMVSWLIENGADISHRTIIGEEQRPIHYAARYDAIETFRCLVELGANPLDVDACKRTPFFLAAEAGHSNMCSFLLDLELPVVSYAKSGVATIDHIIENLPTDLAIRSLDQFISINQTTAKASIYLSCLGKRRWRILNPDYELKTAEPPSPFEIIVRRRDLNLIDHPVVLEMIELKTRRIGKNWNILNIILHLMFTVLWTSCATIRVNDFGRIRLNNDENRNTVIVLAVISQLLTCVFMYKIFREWKATTKDNKEQQLRIFKEIESSKQFCHPRWRNDFNILQKKVEASENMSTKFWSDGWSMIEVVCLIMASVYFVINVIWFVEEELKLNSVIRDVRLIYSVIFVMFIWIRLNRCLQANRSIGPFIDMLAKCVVALVQIFFLFFEFYVPFAVSFWVTFGNVAGSPGPGEHYKAFNDLLYEIWLMSFVGDFAYNPLKDVNSLMSQLLVGLYFVLVSIITINIYIALLTDAFARVNEIAVQRAYMEEANFSQLIEKTMPEYKRSFEKYLNRFCAPKMINKATYDATYKEGSVANPRTVVATVLRDVVATNDTMQKIIAADVAIKKNIIEMSEKVSQLKVKYTESKVRDSLTGMAKVFATQSGAIAKVVRGANWRMSMLMHRIFPE